MKKVSLQEAGDLKGKRVLVRSDFNVDLTDSMEIVDDLRIQRALPTYRYLIDAGAKVVAMTHLGRPKGEADDKLKVDAIAGRLGELLKVHVTKTDDCIGDAVRSECDALQNGEVLMLENTRFHSEDQDKDSDFAKELASLADVYVSDAFGVSHRGDASVAGVAKYLPTFSGLLIEQELAELDAFAENPEKPYVFVIGGAKLKTKIGLINNLIDTADHILVGGALANTFLKAQGFEIGKSLYEEEFLKDAEAALTQAGGNADRLILPTDVVVAEDMDSNVIQTVPVEAIPSDMSVYDIGPETTVRFGAFISEAASLAMNGAMGVFEQEQFATGTRTVFQDIAVAKVKKISGGGETIIALNNYNLADKIDFISTGGGAMLSYLEGASMPGLEVIPNKP
ncbi:phosphoglycerate kinase [Patescibacteria group bacterium]